jgi:hypothetical protein
MSRVEDIGYQQNHTAASCNAASGITSPTKLQHLRLNIDTPALGSEAGAGGQHNPPVVSMRHARSVESHALASCGGQSKPSLLLPWRLHCLKTAALAPSPQVKTACRTAAAARQMLAGFLL